MWVMLFPILAGIACILLGISNMRGNISTIHEYHRKRVTEENRLPFGKMVGLGTILVGFGIVFFGVLSMISEWTQMQLVMWIGIALMAAGFAAGISVSFYEMFKYNKGIF